MTKRTKISALIAAVLCLSITLALMLPPGGHSVKADGPPFLVGDVDGNGKIDTSDARLILQSIVGKAALTPEMRLPADVNSDGKIDTVDARLILQYIVEKIKEFPFDYSPYTTTASETTESTATTTTATGDGTLETQHTATPPVTPEDLTKATDAVIKDNPDTFCNPINVSYQYQTDYKSRESADPCMITYKGEYYLFASHGSGYWWSDDMCTWNFVYCMGAEMAKFAPAACIVDGALYICHSEGGGIYKSTDPKSADSWQFVRTAINGWGDPSMLTDDDGSVYVYFGTSNNAPIYGVQLDPNNNMAIVQGPCEMFNMNPAAHGFEVPGDQNQYHWKDWTANPPETNGNDCWLEGSWMTKYNGKYYLQYAVPGTEYASYADGCYISDGPLGPFTYCDNSPVSYNATGFAVGAGHGSTFQDLQGNWWKIDTVSIAANTGFERRLTIFPAEFNAEGNLVTNMVQSDYPLYLPGISDRSFDDPGPGWQLVDYNPANLTASSTLAGHSASMAFNENIRNWWSANTGDAGEWIQADLGKLCAVNAVQLNFADQDVPTTVSGRDNTYVYRYKMEFSQDGTTWYPLADHSDATAAINAAQDYSHDYYELAATIGVRYIRVTNEGPVPGGGKFAVSGIRLFGNGQGTAPAKAANLAVNRPAADERTAAITWSAAAGAQGYNIRLGLSPDALNLHYQVIGATSATIRFLNMGVGYYFTVDSYNDSGYTKGTETQYVAATKPAPPNKPINPPPPPLLDPAKDSGYTVYEAENAAKIAVASVANDSGASGGKSVHNMHLTGAYIEFDNVDGGPDGGDATLRIAYSCGNPSGQFDLYVNGVKITTVTLQSTGDWNTFKMMDLPILTGLTPGAANTIRLSNGGATDGAYPGFNPDYIQVIYPK